MRFGEDGTTRDNADSAVTGAMVVRRGGIVSFWVATDVAFTGSLSLLVVNFIPFKVRVRGDEVSSMRVQPIASCSRLHTG